MKNIFDNRLFVGNIDDIYGLSNEEWAIVHATQTIHYQIFNWNRTTNKPNKNHPNYIYYEKENHLSLNWVDGAAILYRWSGNDTFEKILNFIDKWITQRKVLVHCDQGFSRSPAICLLYLAKRAKIISNISYKNAKEEFNQQPRSKLPRYEDNSLE
jgi:protein-tyrosine phosphatase